MTDRHDDELRFAAEDSDTTPVGSEQTWKLLVVDDDEFVHKVTTLVLRGYSFEGAGLTILSAHSAAEGRQMLMDNPDTAVMLLDVVMETPQAGLEMAEWVRNEMENRLVRIILRTGQPGEAPEQEVIFKYDINDYKEKAELTAQKLYTTVTTAIRSYRDMRAIERSRQGLAQILTATPTLFRPQSLSDFASGVLTQLASTVCQGDDTLMARAAGVAAERRGDQFRVIASTGKFKQSQGKSIAAAADPQAISAIERAAECKRSFFQEDAFIGYYRTPSGSETIIYLRGAMPIGEDNQQLIEIFSSNISAAFDNIDLNNGMHETQRELLFTLGEALENRSPVQDNHVRRVAEYARLLALKAGMNESDANALRLAATMHDVGKLGIPDNVLLKPGHLDDAELHIIRKHPEIGYDILKDSTSPIMQLAAVVALRHHERWNGSGYPRGLQGEEIELMARIVMLADVFDALGNDRPHRSAWPMDDVFAFIEENRGTMFDPTLADLLLDSREEFLEIRRRFDAPDPVTP
jgi:response regulator RpfG family c-di-GMP phosphodiesterase